MSDSNLNCIEEPNNIVKHKYQKVNNVIYTITKSLQENFIKFEQIANYIYKYFGDYHTENIYKNAFAIEFEKEGYTVEIEKEIDVMYEGKKCGYIKADLLLEKENEKLVIEIKRNSIIKHTQVGQLAKYLSALDYSEGFVINLINNYPVCYYVFRQKVDNEYFYIVYDGKKVDRILNVGVN